MSGTVHFGLVLSGPEAVAGVTAAELEPFDCLKVASDQLLEQENAARLRKVFPGRRILAGELAERPLCELAPEEGIKLRLDFVRRLEERCRQVKAAGAVAGTAPFDLARAAIDFDYRNRLLELLRCCCGVLQAVDFPLLLPWRVPSPPGGAASGACGDFLRSLPLARLGVLAEWHPHEPAFAALPDGGMNPIRFEARDVEIIYEPATGNRLTSRLLEARLERLLLPGRDLRVYFHAAGLADDGWAVEIAELSALVRQLRNEHKEWKKC